MHLGCAAAHERDLIDCSVLQDWIFEILFGWGRRVLEEIVCSTPRLALESARQCSSHCQGEPRIACELGALN